MYSEYILGKKIPIDPLQDLKPSALKLAEIESRKVGFIELDFSNTSLPESF
jgi:hypothetical protein